MTTDNDAYDEPAIRLTEDERVDIPAFQEALRRLAARLELEQHDEDDDCLVETIFVYAPWRIPGRDDARWLIYRTVGGARVADMDTGEAHRRSTMREAQALVVGIIEAETAAMIAAIPRLTLPQLPMLGR